MEKEWWLKNEDIVTIYIQNRKIIVVNSLNNLFTTVNIYIPIL